MNKNDWYNTESWYAPRQEEAPAAAEKPKKKKGLKPWHIGAILGLLVVLIVATSLIFSGSGGKSPADDRQRGDSETLPDDWAEFFKNYYTGVETDIAEINIPRGDLCPDFELTLAPPAEELDLQELYERCADSIVAITAYTDGSAGYFWGTGVIISEDGLILTNTHVIDDCDSATVTLYDDRSFEATLVGADSFSDLAVLKIDADGLPTAVFGESSDLAVGERVAAIGNPLGQTFRSTLTDGIISAIERGINYNGHSMTLLQTNTAINEGNSGGALFNMSGQVIGITNMKMMSSYSSIEGIGFAIPSATVRGVVNSIVKYGEVRGRPAIGITVGGIPENAASRYELPEGLYVSAVTPGTDAEAKGVLEGDIITEVNHTPVKTTTDVNDIKNGLQVGDTMLFTIWRDGEILEIEVQLMDQNDVYGG
ncbi:MAG: trypsin-like peptidase domain-containing protein [Oscillospiraceae bacterium]|nr:trypsin-like peptidase domain-containing protein [Oscillospiraceae bacterium]